MASDVGIVNAALSKLGASTILTMTDATKEGRLATRTYADLRDNLLREHPWNFATKRISLAASTTSPDWEYDNAFILPTDFLRLLEVYNENKYAYKIESTDDGRVIATDLGAPLKIKYVARIEDAEQMDPSFREALSARLAMEWAEPITGTSTVQASMAKLYQEKLRMARTVDGQEDTVTVLDSSTWTDARL